MVGCEKTEIHKTLNADSNQIEVREVDDCTDCPVADCCCSVTLLSGPDVQLELCGTSSPTLTTMTCGPIGTDLCNDISGYIEIVQIESGDPTGLFCVAKNTPFGIISSTGAATVRVTCQVGQTNPQSVNITLNTPGAKPYWQVNGDCELEPCE